MPHRNHLDSVSCTRLWIGYNGGMEKDKKKQPKSPPDGRGKRPKDPNQLAKWVVEQTTGQESQKTNRPPKDKTGN